MDPLSLRVRELPLVFLDLETTGLKADEGDEILEFGAVKTVGGLETARMDTLVKPSRPIPPESAKVHGITDLFVAGAPAFDAIADEITAFIEGSVILAHNAPFDVGFLAIAFEKSGRRLPENVVIDTVMLARNVMPSSPNHKLETLKKHFDVAAERSHRALDDSLSLSRVFHKMLDAHFHAIGGGPTLAEVAAKAPPVFRFDDFGGGLPLKSAEQRALVRWALRDEAELVISYAAPTRLIPEDLRAVPRAITKGGNLEVFVKARGADSTLQLSRVKSVRRAS